MRLQVCALFCIAYSRRCAHLTKEELSGDSFPSEYNSADIRVTRPTRLGTLLYRMYRGKVRSNEPKWDCWLQKRIRVIMQTGAPLHTLFPADSSRVQTKAAIQENSSEKRCTNYIWRMYTTVLIVRMFWTLYLLHRISSVCQFYFLNGQFLLFFFFFIKCKTYRYSEDRNAMCFIFLTMQEFY